MSNCQIGPTVRPNCQFKLNKLISCYIWGVARVSGGETHEIPQRLKSIQFRIIARRKTWSNPWLPPLSILATGIHWHSIVYSRLWYAAEEYVFLAFLEVFYDFSVH